MRTMRAEGLIIFCSVILRKASRNRKFIAPFEKQKLRLMEKKSKPDYKLLCGDKIGYPELVQKADLTDSPNLNDHIALIKNSIVYDSKNFVVINKPPNYAVHGGSGLNFGVIEIVRKFINTLSILI